jgi:hypothetical protein
MNSNIRVDAPTSKHLKESFNNAQHSDCSLSFRESNNVLHLHKVLLSCCLNCELKNEITIDEDEYRFTQMLKTIYGYAIDVTREELLPLVTLAKKYEYKDLLPIIAQSIAKIVRSLRDAKFLTTLWELRKEPAFAVLTDDISHSIRALYPNNDITTYYQELNFNSFQDFLVNIFTAHTTEAKLIMSWINHDVENRKQHCYDLFAQVYASPDAPKPVDSRESSLLVCF